MAQGRVALVMAAVIGLLLIAPGSLNADEYRVLEGDTLSEIAERYGMTVEELAEANGIVDPNYILSGRVLLIPGGAAGHAAISQPGGQAPGGVTYVIQFGDTLSEIAERFGVPAVTIVKANGLADPHFIVEGVTLTIPVIESPLVSPVSPQIETLLEEFAAVEGLDAGLVKALAYTESGWQQDAVSASGAAGVMQIVPSTGYWLEAEVFGYGLNIETSAYDNIKAGARYLRILLDLTDDIDQAVAAYYQGYSTLSLGILYEDTIEYVASVNAIKDWFWG